MLKCDFNKISITRQHWNSPVNLLHIFQNAFLKEYPRRAASVIWIYYFNLQVTEIVKYERPIRHKGMLCIDLCQLEAVRVFIKAYTSESKRNLSKLLYLLAFTAFEYHQTILQKNPTLQTFRCSNI